MNLFPFKILIVEDDVNLNRGLMHVIKKMGYEVYSTTSGEQALKQIKQHSFDLVISDLKLPGIDGKQVLKAAKQCAIIVVDEVLLREKDIIMRRDRSWGKFEWQEVKQEILTYGGNK